MHPQNESGRQLEIMGVRWNSRSNNQPDKDVPDLTDHCSTVVQSPERVDHPELLGRKRRLFSAWTIKLHNDNQLRVEGMLEWYVSMHPNLLNIFVILLAKGWFFTSSIEYLLTAEGRPEPNQ